MKISRRIFLLGGVSAGTLLATPVVAESCGCGSSVPNNQFGQGTVNRPADFNLEFCIPDEIWASIIQGREDRVNPWILRLLTFNADGSVRWHKSQTVLDGQCRTQGVYRGTFVATYITCKEYTGWLVAEISDGRPPVFQRVHLNMTWQELDRKFPSS